MNILQKHKANLERLRAKIKSICAGAMFMGTLLLAQDTQAQNFVFDTAQINPFGLGKLPATFASTASLGDLDNDGDLDLLSGSYGNYVGDFFYYENTGGATNPSFTAPLTNPFGLTNQRYGLTPRLIDLDNDDDLDVIAGNLSGDFFYYENTGTTTTPSFAAPLTNPFGLTAIVNEVGGLDLIDLDNDGDLDMLSGDSNGSFYYYENVGTISNPSFSARLTNPFGLVGATGSNPDNSPTFVDADGDGDFDILRGSFYGNFYYYQNTGSNVNPVYSSATINPFGLDSLPDNLNTFCVADLDGDGDRDLLSGLYDGNFYYFQNQSINTSIKKSTENQTLIFPNPAQDVVNLQTSTPWTNATIRLANLNGQIIQQQRINGNQISLNLANLPKAIYIVEIETATQVSQYKIHKQ